MTDDAQMSLFGKDAGMALALTKDGIEGWKDAFRDWVEALPPGAAVTSEDILAAVGLPTGEVGMNANNAVGAMVNGLARRGILRKSATRVRSRRRSSHAAELVLWVRTRA